MLNKIPMAFQYTLAIIGAALVAMTVKNMTADQSVPEGSPSETEVAQNSADEQGEVATSTIVFNEPPKTRPPAPPPNPVDQVDQLRLRAERIVKDNEHLLKEYEAANPGQAPKAKGPPTETDKKIDALQARLKKLQSQK